MKVDRAANALVIIAAPADAANIRAIVSGIDVKDPTVATAEAVQLHFVNADEVVAKLRAVFSKARFAVAPNRTVVIAAPTIDMGQIKAVIAAIDTPPVPPTPKPVFPTQTLSVVQADPRTVAHDVA